MKKIYTLVGAALLATTMSAQVSFSDNFDTRTLGALGPQSSDWTTWSGTEGGAEDAIVVNTSSQTAPNSIYFVSTAANGGPQDVILPFGGQYNTGTFSYSMDMYVTANKGAYFNFQGETTPGNLFAMECYLPQTGDMFLTNTTGTLFQGSYPNAQWFNLRFDINLNTNSWEVYINNVLQGTFANTVNQIASIDIYGYNGTNAGGNGQAEFWIDNVAYSYTPYLLPARNGAIISTGAMNPATRQPAAFTGFVGQPKKLACNIRNLGTTNITSFDIAVTYNSNTTSQTISSVNIPSLGTYTVEFSTPVALISGNNPAVFTVSNVNGQGADDDLTDDASTNNINITVVPAANRVVVGEEGTGTWCQWCPRGAIYMDYMAETYEGYFAGIAVHNADPMALTTYDSPFSALISGYPSSLVDRGQDVDPSGMETDFLQRLAIPGHANVGTGAQVTGNTLNVSLTYTFTQAANSNYKVLCVLVEDSVTGGSGYAQSNAYANNAAGPMGGFESLPASVPAAQMNYNHVARALSPSFTGAPNVFPAVVNIGDVNTFNFSFNLPATWDQNQMHIIGILIDPQGRFDNGGEVTVADAISNGFVSGTQIVGIENPDQPDTQISLYPNPTNSTSFMSLNLKQEEVVTVIVRDVTGKVVAQRNYGSLNGAQVLEINTAGFASGIYMVETQIGNSVQTTRLAVQ
jgi:hypothetical protein